MSTSRSWDQIISGAVQKEIAAIAAEEAEAAKARIDQRISERMAEIIMAAMRQFDVHRNEDRIIISVRDERGR